MLSGLTVGLAADLTVAQPVNAGGHHLRHRVVPAQGLRVVRRGPRVQAVRGAAEDTLRAVRWLRLHRGATRTRPVEPGGAAEDLRPGPVLLANPRVGPRQVIGVRLA